MPSRRSTDQFNPEPMPDRVPLYRQQSWAILQELRFHQVQINGAVGDHEVKIRELDKDITVARKLGYVILAIIAIAVPVIAMVI